MTRNSYTCDAQCPTVTRTHMSQAAVTECQDRRANGKPSRAAALTYRPEDPFEIVTVRGRDFSGKVVRDNLAGVALLRPNFSHSRLDMHASGIEGAHLPGADLRNVESPEFVPGVPIYAMAEARGAIVDDAVVEDATHGENSWLLSEVEETPDTNDARVALDFVVPFLQWSFTGKQWDRLLAEGYDADELVEAAQEFPPRNEAGFKEFMDSGDAAASSDRYPHNLSWGYRALVIPPASHARTRQQRSQRSGRRS